MSEVKPTTPLPAANLSASPDLTPRLAEIFTKLLPLVDSVADKLRFALILGGALIAWIFIWLYFLKHFALGTALIIVGLAILPLLVLARFWWALEEIKDLPQVADQMVGDAKGHFTETLKGIQAGDVTKVSMLGSVKKLWNIGALATDARGLLGSYLSIGTLANPLSLIMGVLSLLFVILLVLVSIVLLVLALF